MARENPVEVPGAGPFIRKEDFFAFWLNQHQEQVIEFQKRSQGDEIGDSALIAYNNYPEVVEDNHN